MKTAVSIRSTILSHIEQVASEQNKKLASLDDDLPLLESGLDSLSLAILVARLEEALGFDPFTTSSEVYYPTTLGDFISFYEKFEPATGS
jgi:acyl carrier protein